MSQDFNAVISNLATTIVEELVAKIKEGLTAELSKLAVSVHSDATVEFEVPDPLLKNTDSKNPDSKGSKTPKKEGESAQSLFERAASSKKGTATKDSATPPKVQTSNAKTTNAKTTTVKGQSGLPTSQPLIEFASYNDITSKERYDYSKKLNKTELDELSVLPTWYIDAFKEMSAFDSRGVYLSLQAFWPNEWEALLSNTDAIDYTKVIAKASGQTPEEQDEAIKYLKEAFFKLTKIAKKKEREYNTRQANIQRIADTKARKAAALKKKEDAVEINEPSTTLEPIYTPTIAKHKRIKIGIIGLKPDNQNMMQLEFGNTFCLTMADGEDGTTKVRNINDISEKVLLVKKFIPHTHTNLIDRAKIIMVDGAMTRVREHLSNLAKQLYPITTT
jgi:hypothetical protein